MGRNLSGLPAFRQVLHTHNKETGCLDYSKSDDDNENHDVITFRAVTTSCTRGRNQECWTNLGSAGVLNIQLSKVNLEIFILEMMKKNEG